jgi:hypothetical protein
VIITMIIRARLMQPLKPPSTALAGKRIIFRLDEIPRNNILYELLLVKDLPS